MWVGSWSLFEKLHVKHYTLCSQTRYIGFIIKLRQEASGFNVCWNVNKILYQSKDCLFDWKHFCQYVVIGDALFEIIFYEILKEEEDEEKNIRGKMNILCLYCECHNLDRLYSMLYRNFITCVQLRWI